MIRLKTLLSLAALVIFAIGYSATSNAAQNLSNAARPGAAQNFSQFLVGKKPLKITPLQRSAVLSARHFGGQNFSCNGSYCACTGDADCNDMFTTNVCGPTAVCIGTSCFCGRH